MGIFRSKETTLMSIIFTVGGFLVFWERVSFCGPDWSDTWHVAKVVLDYRHVLPCSTHCWQSELWGTDCVLQNSLFPLIQILAKLFQAVWWQSLSNFWMVPGWGRQILLKRFEFLLWHLRYVAWWEQEV